MKTAWGVIAAARSGLIALLLAGAAAGPAGALAPGDRCPGFDLPWLDGEGRETSEAILARAPVTVLLFWNRECPHCADLALNADYLAAEAAAHDAQVVPVVFGPDDPVSLRALIAQEGVRTRQLWDAAGAVAQDFGLGLEHLGVFVTHADGRVAAAFHGEISDLLGDVLPAVAEAARTAPEAAPGARPSEPAAATSGLPRLHTDGRMRLLTTEGAEPGDLGLYGETLESGALFLARWDLRLVWEVAPGVTFVPWLRVSNEDEVLLTEGPEQFASRHGTASLHLERGRVAATLGAFPLRLSPLLLQRWDEEDAPPLGGVSGCSSCGAGASGLSQRSLEVLRPEYRFEGASARWTGTFTTWRAWVAVPRWEEVVPRGSGAPAADSLDAHYRRVMHGAAVDFGWTGRRDPVFGLPAPFGLRIGYLNVGDDARTLDAGSIRPGDEWDEDGVTVLAAAGPCHGLVADAEHVWWHRTRRTAETIWDGGWVTRWSGKGIDPRAARAGLRGEWTAGGGRIWARAHRIWAEPGFEPLYAALTYEANREGWRGAAGYERSPQGGRALRLTGIGAFYRVTGETDPAAGGNALEETVASASLRGRIGDRLEAQLHGVRTTVDYPGPRTPDEKTLGVSVDLRWTEWAAVDPFLRVDAIRRDPEVTDPHWVWQAYMSVRVLR